MFYIHIYICAIYAHFIIVRAHWIEILYCIPKYFWCTTLFSVNVNVTRLTYLTCGYACWTWKVETLLHNIYVVLNYRVCAFLTFKTNPLFLVLSLFCAFVYICVLKCCKRHQVWVLTVRNSVRLRFLVYLIIFSILSVYRKCRF